MTVLGALTVIGVRARRLAWALLAGVGLLAPLAQAHELSMAELMVREVARGEFVVQWGAGEKSAPADSMTPQWPAHCRAEGMALRCGDQGLTGVMSVKGVGDRFSAALVKVSWLDGQSRVYTITAGQPTARLFGSAEDQRDMGEVAWAYTTLGVEHILSGIDHLLFVGALLFLVGFRRQLVWTISAFTLAHSLTLASAALGWLTLRSPPVEASIALSIVLVAGEALHTSKNGRQTLARRWPALVAFLFGLVHGLGFAGALKDIGLPQQHLVAALLSFNLGVELGQLFAVGVVALLLWALRGQRRLPALRTPVLYGIGSLAAYWSWLRVAAIVGLAA
jgi:hydrogenase/urease accessory protein HupE